MVTLKTWAQHSSKFSQNPMISRYVLLFPRFEELRELLKNSAASASQRPERPSAQSVASAFSSRPWETGEESGPSEGAIWGRFRMVMFVAVCLFVCLFVCLSSVDSLIDWMDLKKNLCTICPANMARAFRGFYSRCENDGVSKVRNIWVFPKIWENLPNHQF